MTTEPPPELPDSPESAEFAEFDEIDESAAPPRARRPRGRWRGRLLRIFGALVVLALTGAVTAAGLLLPVPAQVEVRPLAVRVPPVATTLVCPGPLVRPADARTGDSAFDPTPVDTLTQVRALTVSGAAGSGSEVAASATLKPLAGGAPLATIDPAGASTGALGVSSPGVPTLLRAEPTGEAPRVGGATASLTTAGDLRGLAAESCQPPAGDQWLLGGSTALGSSSLLVVANPGATPAQVSIDLFGPSGKVDLAGGGGFLVAPGAERALLLEGVAAEQQRIAVHVSAEGGLVTAHVQDNRLNGFTPAGTDLVSAGTAPATRQVVSGLVVRGSKIDAPDAAQLRLLAPDADTTARIHLLGPKGPVALPGADSVDLARGEVTDLSLGGLPAGAYTAVVDADKPVTSAVMITRPGKRGPLDTVPPLERAWGAAATPGTGGVLALPVGVTGTVMFTGVGSDREGSGGGPATGTLRTIGANGAILDEREISVPAGSSESISVQSIAGARAKIAGFDLQVPDDASSGGAKLAWSLLANVDAADGQLISLLNPTTPAAAQPSVPVLRARTLGLP
ncbi:DUF5719 family protein [Pengzhenrongella sp.]|jgi:hypothetical protein|uniref:DUF5719 family protein n=1 Tax=Pengzhenrongella sp. TaxID=2888820 RepID=UPI002F95954B